MRAWRSSSSRTGASVAGKDNTAQAITNRATGMLSTVRDAMIFALTPPAIQGLGQSEGFDFELQATPGTDRAALAKARDQLVGAANQDPLLMAVRRGDLPETPQLKIDIDEAKAVALGLAPSDITARCPRRGAGSTQRLHRSRPGP